MYHKDESVKELKEIRAWAWASTVSENREYDSDCWFWDLHHIDESELNKERSRTIRMITMVILWIWDGIEEEEEVWRKKNLEISVIERENLLFSLIPY